MCESVFPTTITAITLATPCSTFTTLPAAPSLHSLQHLHYTPCSTFTTLPAAPSLHSLQHLHYTPCSTFTTLHAAPSLHSMQHLHYTPCRFPTPSMCYECSASATVNELNIVCVVFMLIFQKHIQHTMGMNTQQELFTFTQCAIHRCT